MKSIKYTQEEFILAVQTSFSIRQVLIKLKLNGKGGNYRTIKSNIKKYNLDISHFTGQAHNKNKRFGPKRKIEEYLNNKRFITSHSLRKRLLDEKIFEHKCYCCNNILWNNLPIPLELHHKDGNHYNNNLQNLTLLCPNCHAQTDTYKGRNNKKQKKQKTKKSQKGIPKPHTRKVTRPSLETLEKEVQENGFVATGHKYGVSDNSIRKWIRFYKLYGQTSPN